MRKQLSAPVSLMVIVIGAALSYYVLHTKGWSLNGEASLSYVYRGLPFQSRALVVVGFVLTAWVWEVLLTHFRLEDETISLRLQLK
jgi:hypothetical protein